MDFAILRGCLILGPRMAAALRFFLFERVFRKSVCNEICKESRGRGDFTILQGCLILGPRMAAALRFFLFERFFRKTLCRKLELRVFTPEGPAAGACVPLEEAQ